MVEKSARSPVTGYSSRRVQRRLLQIRQTSKILDLSPRSSYVYDRDRDIRQWTPNTQLLEKYLDEIGEIRVYRDGIRIYNYDKQGNDWLGLDLCRVNVPTRRISRNIILGAIHLSLKESAELIGKTNREAFIDNKACQQLCCIALGALAALEVKRQLDKERIRKLTKKAEDPVSARIDKPIQELRRELKRKGVQEKFESHVAKIEQGYQNMQDILLAAGMSGLNLSMVFHEVERGVRALHQTISEGADMESAALQTRNLMRLLDGFARLLRRDSKKQYSSSRILDDGCWSWSSLMPRW